METIIAADYKMETSQYCKTLDATSKNRYLSKIEAIKIDPYSLKESEFNKCQGFPKKLLPSI
jgi:hypothetical protein